MPVTLQHVTFQQTDNLGELAIDNPPLNILDADMFAELPIAVAQAAAGDIRAVLIRAEGDDFSAGPDPSVFFGLDETTAQGLAAQILGFTSRSRPFRSRPSR